MYTKVAWYLFYSEKNVSVLVPDDETACDQQRKGMADQKKTSRGSLNNQNHRPRERS